MFAGVLAVRSGFRPLPMFALDFRLRISVKIHSDNTTYQVALIRGNAPVRIFSFRLIRTMVRRNSQPADRIAVLACAAVFVALVIDGMDLQMLALSLSSI